MKGRTAFSLMGLTALIATSLGYMGAQAQMELVQSEELAAEDLGPHFECLEGKVMLAARHVIPPGFVGPQHSHVGRPEIFFVLEGSIVEQQNGTETEYHAGEAFVSNADHTKEHRITNPGDRSATVMDVQIIGADRVVEAPDRD